MHKVRTEVLTAGWRKIRTWKRRFIELWLGILNLTVLNVCHFIAQSSDSEKFDQSFVCECVCIASSSCTVVKYHWNSYFELEVRKEWKVKKRDEQMRRESKEREREGQMGREKEGEIVRVKISSKVNINHFQVETYKESLVLETCVFVRLYFS